MYSNFQINKKRMDRLVQIVNAAVMKQHEIDVEMQESCRKLYCSSNWTQYSPQLNDTAKTAIDNNKNDG